MLKSRISLFALALACSPLAVLAQTTSETPAETSADAPTEAPAEARAQTTTADAATAEGLAIGIPTGGDVQLGQIYLKEKFENWEQRCEKTKLDADPCQLYQLLKDAQGNSVAEISIFSLPETATGPAVAGATFVAPLETLLTEGMRLTVDTNQPRAYPFNVCSNVGCVSRIGFTAEEVAMFKKGANATFTILPFVAPDQKVELKASLKGFTAGYDAVVASNKAADAAMKAAKSQ